jgi:hypothetical protein
MEQKHSPLALCDFYGLDVEMILVGVMHRRSQPMNTFRTCRPLLIKARQCTYDAWIVTDFGKRQVRIGDWIIEGENHEQYVVDNAFFQRTFVSIPWEPTGEVKQYGC